MVQNKKDATKTRRHKGKFLKKSFVPSCPGGKKDDLKCKITKG
jgi:hypothetical protein